MGSAMASGSVFSEGRVGSIRYSFPKDKIKVLLLENIHPSGLAMLKDEGFDVQTSPKAMEEAELVQAIQDVHILGIRSKTRVTEAVLHSAKRLLAVGCFCIGTDQVNLVEAERRGVPVFNAPFSNTRSVAELVIAEIVLLARKLGDRSGEMHQGMWNKSASGSFEVRGKTIGIVGYGHIGTQVSILAEAMGMRVIYYDIIPQLPLGNSSPCSSLDELLESADFVSLHVPKSDLTNGMIGPREIAKMKSGSYLINNARGTVVDLEALAGALKSGHLAGAAIDVFPLEPAKNGPNFSSPLQQCPNTILTPHIGGSTVEAQEKIGQEVATLLIKFVNGGSTVGAVNFPNLELPFSANSHRILSIHRNKPGVLRDINNIFAGLDTNVRTQVLGTTQEIGYLIVDVEKETSDETKEGISDLAASIRTRILY